MIETVLADGRVRRTFIDLETGEVVGNGIHGYRATTKPPGKVDQPPFAKLWMPNLLKLIRDKELKQGEKALLFDLLVFLDWQSTMLVHPESGHAVSSREIADYIGLSSSFVSDTLTALHDKGIIGKFSAGKGRPFKYHFNCNIAFFGKNLNDPRDYERFNTDCAFTPKIRIDYKKEDRAIHMIRRDLNTGVTPMSRKKE